MVFWTHRRFTGSESKHSPWHASAVFKGSPLLITASVPWMTRVPDITIPKETKTPLTGWPRIPGGPVLPCGPGEPGGPDKPGGPPVPGDPYKHKQQAQ